jgi:hypothetical protein
LADTSGGSFNLTLPASPNFGSTILIADGTGSFSTNNLTVLNNGSTIANQNADLLLNLSNTVSTLVYTGTTWQFITTAGTVGAQGAQGVQGVAGAQGVQGVLGAQGVQGATGPQGFQGVLGAQGVQGTTGAPGAQGVQGTVGAQGVQGATGPTAGSANQVIFRDAANTINGSANLTFSGTLLTVTGNVIASNIGFSTSGTLKAYQTWNASANSIDTIFL